MDFGVYTMKDLMMASEEGAQCNCSGTTDYPPPLFHHCFLTVSPLSRGAADLVRGGLKPFTAKKLLQSARLDLDATLIVAAQKEEESRRIAELERRHKEEETRRMAAERAAQAAEAEANRHRTEARQAEQRLMAEEARHREAERKMREAHAKAVEKKRQQDQAEEARVREPISRSGGEWKVAYGCD